MFRLKGIFVFILVWIAGSFSLASVSGVLNPIQVHAGNSTCIFFSGNSIKCWGLNGYGQLGLGDSRTRGLQVGDMGDKLAYVNFGTTDKVIQISSRGDHTCLLFDTNKVKCWGDNYYGQLGLGDANYRGDAADEMGQKLPYVNFGTTDKIVELAAGYFHSCILFDSNKVKCWGLNSSSQLGSGNTNNLGDAAIETGIGLPYVNLGTDEKILMLRAGGRHTCALFESNRLKCWGVNDSGQLGLGDTNNRGDTANEMGANLPFIDFGVSEKIVDMRLGGNHSCVVFESQKMKCWGANAGGQLGYEDTTARGTQAGDIGKLPFVDLGFSAKIDSISLGESHTCILLRPGYVKCWGLNSSGQLGLGDMNNRGDSKGEMGKNLEFVTIEGVLPALALSAGKTHTCAILINKTVKCWGENTNGQLGYEDSMSRGDNVNEMSTSLPFVNLGTQ